MDHFAMRIRTARIARAESCVHARVSLLRQCASILMRRHVATLESREKCGKMQSFSRSLIGKSARERYWYATKEHDDKARMYTRSHSATSQMYNTQTREVTGKLDNYRRSLADRPSRARASTSRRIAGPYRTSSRDIAATPGTESPRDTSQAGNLQTHREKPKEVRCA